MKVLIAQRGLSNIYPWAAKFISIGHCSSCEIYSGDREWERALKSAFCLICNRYITISHPQSIISYFKHILSHYGIDTEFVCESIKYSSKNDGAELYTYEHIKQLIFTDVYSQRGKFDYRWDEKYRYDFTYNTVMEATGIIRSKISNLGLICMLCKQSGIDTFYETFPTMEVIVSHIKSRHVVDKVEKCDLPPLLEFLSSVTFA